MPSMKKVNDPVSDFYIPEKRYCFWVRVVVQTTKPGLRKQHNTKAYIYVAILAKITQNTLPK